MTEGDETLLSFLRLPSPISYLLFTHLFESVPFLKFTNT